MLAARCLAAAGLLAAEPPGARDRPEGSAEAGEPGYEQPLKMTATFMGSGDRSAVDLNVRRKAGAFLLWAGAFLSDPDSTQARLGAEWDQQAWGLFFAPAVQVATNGSIGGQVYAETGGELYGIVGAGRTNARDVVNLTFDPNDCWQVGAGLKLPGGDRVFGYVVWDARYGTGQQVSHLFLRRRVAPGWRLTLDASWKSGHGEGGAYVRGWGLSATWDGPAWFVRAAFDGHGNFQPSNMLRVAFGGRL